MPVAVRTRGVHDDTGCDPRYPKADDRRGSDLLFPDYASFRLAYVEETMQESARRNRWRFLQKPFELADLTRELAGAMNKVVSAGALEH